MIAPGLYERDNVQLNLKARRLLSVCACKDPLCWDANNTGRTLPRLHISFTCERLHDKIIRCCLLWQLFLFFYLKQHATWMCKAKVRTTAVWSPGEINSTAKYSVHFASGGSAGCFIFETISTPFSFLGIFSPCCWEHWQPGSPFSASHMQDWKELESLELSLHLVS